MEGIYNLEVKGRRRNGVGEGVRIMGKIPRSYVFGAPETFLKFKDDVIRITRLIINYLPGTMQTNHITLTIMHIEFSLMFLKP